MNKLAFVVPTKDRPEDLRKLLASIAAQTRKPDQIVVVDGSDPPIRHVLAEFPLIPIEYERVFPPSLAQQRNAGMRRIAENITVAGYLDDDIVLDPDAVERMMEFWDAADLEIGGGAFNILNNPRPSGLLLKSLFLIDSPLAGTVLRSGFPSTIPCQDKRIEADWLYGGATVWRREVIAAYAYDEWFVGTGFMEDIDYSFRVRERYRLVLVAEARLAHYSRPVRPDRQFLLGWWQIVNRMYFVRKFRGRGMSIPLAWWASLGLIALNVAAGVRRLNPRYLNRARGNIAGVFAVLFGTAKQTGGHLK